MSETWSSHGRTCFEPVENGNVLGLDDLVNDIELLRTPVEKWFSRKLGAENYLFNAIQLIHLRTL